MQIETLIQSARDRIQELQAAGANAKAEGMVGQLAAQRIRVEKFLTDLLAANAKRLIGDFVSWDCDGSTLTGKVRQLIVDPTNCEMAIVGTGSTCHVVPVAELKLAGKS